jgi:anti-sigma factor RsiW
VNGATHIPQDDLALYSMQALSPEEQAAVRAHLEGCAACRGALQDILAEEALLGLSIEQAPLPAGAEQRFMARIANTPQSSTSQSSTAAHAAAPQPEISRFTPVEHAPKRGFGFGWLGWVTAVVAIAVAAYLGNRSVDLEQQLNKDRSDITQLSAQAARAQELTDALTSPEAKQVTLTETKQAARPVGHATYLPGKGALIFVASNLHPVAPAKTYELWLIPANGKAPIPAGLFRPDSTGSASVVLPPIPLGVEAKGFGVTIEDAQGSQTPTLPIVLSGS